MKISELVAASGVAKETIHFYLREGLLPRPKKTRRNMAYYDQGHVDRLVLIRRLQNEKYLPLEVIRRVLRGGRPRGGGEDLELLSGLFHLMGGSGGGGPLKREDLRRRSGLDDAAIDRAERAGLVSAGEGGAYEADDLRTLDLLAAVHKESGADVALAIESFALCARHLEAMARDEARLFFDWILRAERPTELVDGMRRARELQARFIAHVRGRSLKRIIGGYLSEIERAVEETGGPSAFAPSPALLERSGFHAQVQGLALREDLAAVEESCFVQFVAGRIEDLSATVERGMLAHPRAAMLRAWAGAADVERGDLDGGIARLEAAVAGGARPIALALLGAARVRLGRRTIEQSGAGSALRQVAAGLEDLARIAVEKREDDRLREGERLRALLARGRVRTSLPPFFRTRESGAADLRAVLAALDGLDGNALPPPAALVLEANAAWFLSVALAVALGEESPESPSLRRRAIAADPDGPIAARLRK
jgi:DNA-binding transcriptional MerR regulator